MNFTAKTAKALRTIANTEHKGLNAAIRTLKGVWTSNNTDLTEALKLEEVSYLYYNRNSF